MSSGWFVTSSICIVTGETRYVVCLCTSSGWFKHIEPHRTFSTRMITEIARCVEFCLMSSGWFGRTEPSLATSSQGKQGMGGAHALVWGCSSKPHDFRESKVCRVLSQVFGRVEPLRLQVLLEVRGSSTECARCVEFFHRRSGWFESTKPSLTTALQGNKVCRLLKL